MSSGSIALERRSRVPAFTLAVLYTVLSVACAAQGSASSDLFSNAVNQPGGPARISALENFLSRAPTDARRSDALEILVWDYLHTGKRKQAETAAKELLSIIPTNPLAAAALSLDMQPGINRAVKQQKIEDQIRALQALEHLSKPAGITDTEFMVMNRQAYAILSGIIGTTYLNQKTYEQARAYLRNAVAVEPDNPQYVYSLALADLNGNNPNVKEGYWSLARAVVLTKGTIGGRQIADYAQNSYLQAGGTAADWSRFLAAARVPGSVPAMPNNSDTETANAQSSVNKKKEDTEAKKPSGKEDEAAEKQTEAEIWKPATPIPESITPEPKRIPFPPGEPVSLGILIEASNTMKGNRAAIVQGLSDIVRRLRPKDEAFILAFSNQLVFEQDLTQNYRLLEQAMDNIKPDSGTALYDAVGFAAGHLKRIASNRNQALLVISDGRNSNSKDSSLQLTSEIANVRIFCIGVNADAPDDRHTLEALATRSGGKAAFISSVPNQFEITAQELAQVIYGEDKTARAR